MEPGCQDPAAVLGLRVALADHQLVVAGGRILLAGKHQPVVGREDDLRVVRTVQPSAGWPPTVRPW
jgi:hypothetical protein